MAHVFDTGIVRYDEIGMVFVYAVIAQMDTRVVETVLIGCVLDSGKTNQSVSIQINDQWVIRRDGHVEAKIALVSVY